MITHRMATQSAPEPPTKLYKVLAIAFLLITAAVFVVIVFVTSKTATIVVQAKDDSKKINLSVSVGDTNSDTAVKGSVSSTRFVWSQKYPVNGTKKVDGVATGKVMLYNKTNAPQPLVKTTRLLAANGELFRLTNSVTVPAEGQIEAEAYADKAGETGDIGPTHFTIPGLPAAKQSQVYADSAAAMTGGVATSGVLSAEDIQKAKDDFKQKVADEFAKSLPVLDPSEGRVYKVLTPNVNVDHVSGDEVSTFTVQSTSTVVTVVYDANALSDVIDKQITSQVNTSAERYLADGNTPTVSFGVYNEKDSSATLAIDQSISVTLDANVEMLAPKNFVGKHKEEIQRYILGLDHVAAVDVKFSPAWVLSAPTTPEKIKVVVKNM